MTDEALGLYHKYNVTRVDGRDAPGERHDGCRYFVLDLNHDEFAISALKAYAEACNDKYPRLSVQLVITAQRIRDGLEPWFHLSEREEMVEDEE